MINIFKKNKETLWKFSAIPGIEESTFNKVLERFYDLGIAGLVRENIQNSLDGKIPGETKPVIVTIKTGKVNKSDIPGLDNIKERIECLVGHNSYTKETIEHMQNKMNQEEVDYISFEDYNTKGLRGAKNGQSYRPEDTWGIYAYNKGVHSEEEDSTLEKSRGGSHGIGKIASNAASELHMMYFANCDEEGNKHLGGTVQLVEHKYKDKYYRSTGYFTDIKKIENNEERFYPYENTFSEIFKKDTRGLKIIIPFLREQFNNEVDIIKSICDSFFIAILENKLEVIVNDKNINSKTIKKYIENKKYYIQDVSEMKEEFTPLYLSTYMKKKTMQITIEDKKEKYNFNLYFNYDESIPKGRVAIIRTIGMKIEDKKVNGNVNKPFNAVLIPDSTKEDAFLKSLENESHTQLSFEHIKDQKLQKNAKRFINNISKVMAKIIEDEIKKSNPTDGIMNTEDVLYYVENQFKQELADSLGTVKLSNGNKDKTVVKIEQDIPKKKDPKDKKEKDKEKKKPLKKVKKKSRNDENDNDEQTEEVSPEKLITYSVHPDRVERLIIRDKEYVKFDFTDTDEMKKVKLCDITLSVVDGMGQEYDNEFNMKDNYEYAIDKATGHKCKIENNLIKDVKVVKGNV
ncbi:MAG: Caspase domain-containing protein [uncultured Clostridium sp.]